MTSGKKIPEDEWFYFAHGKKAASIEDLYKVLTTMHKAEFEHHVNDMSNDFANWIEGVFDETDLAQTLRHSPHKEDMLMILETFLKDEKHVEKYPEKPKAKRLIIPKQVKLKSPEKDLSQEDIQMIAEEANKLVKREEMYASVEVGQNKPLYTPRKYVIKEFIYGFIIGLIFGMIMIGVLLRVSIV